MILGISTNAFTIVHVLISLAGIASGIVVLSGLVANHLYKRSILFFLVTTALTSLTGFAFPNDHITPAIILGILSLIALAVASAAIYLFHLSGRWRSVFVISSMLSLYFNMFVLIAQLFQHVPVLTSIDPHQSGLPFGASQLALLIAFVWLTIVAVKGFRVGGDAPTAA